MYKSTNETYDCVSPFGLQGLHHQNFLSGPSLGTLFKPKYQYFMVRGLWVQEQEPLKDLKAEKG